MQSESGGDVTSLEKKKATGDKKKFKPEDIVLSLWGVVLAFAVQILYDIFGGEFYTRIMPKVYWGLSISVLLMLLLLYYARRLTRA